ncbi:proteinase inhibitor I4 serpin [Haloterrigena turkmenica DSM 5511]|uniref:Proteinase inhibitor I4 serpin n=1 Tax=Haloterrigena turkmenica (strain ATCC 51198 / DSM 5511 / JCM 9101 / NCIMB 13204 / VKM B-1734 / 4k) TaxID=543526 RepID=D2RV02_HALTV|nr:serpin family protein [Haloterrigena turkmenica]ADB59295.1 proteinase inhibitor I4 serpin [Haloterrigena turkmenica DSM 5511]
MTADRRRVLALTGALLAGAAGCLGDVSDAEDPENGDEPANGAEDGALFDDYDVPDFPRLDLTTDPDLESDRLAEQIRGNVAVSFDVLARLREETPGENLFFSPYSISVALAMTYAGARGETAAEMADALRYDLEGEALHAAFGALEGEFEQRNEDGRDVETPAWADEGGEGDGSEGDEDDLGFQLSSANAVWRDEGHDFDDAYVQLLEAYYEAGDHLADFSGSPEAAREEINAWVEERTNDRIEDLLPEGSIDEWTRLVLTNAVYFLAAWEHDFDPAETEPATFTSLDGSETEVDLMHQSQELRYAEIDGHQLVELPYANGDTSMIVVLPAEGEFESFEASFGVDELAIMLEETSQPKVDLALPKFGIESKFSLVETMRELGMERAFDNDADFSGMVEDDDSDLYVDDIIHQSFVEVDEEGTEAAAATAVVMEDTAVADRVKMTVDRPFLFYVRDRPTETPLFVGRVVDGEQLQN